MSGIILENIVKTYEKGSILAVDHVSFQVEEGELFGLIGPDGAGKTSIFRILTTLLLPDSGNGWVHGFNILKDFKAIRSEVGYMPGKFSLYQDLSVEENLHFFATVFNTTIEQNYDLIKDIYVQIEPFKTRKAGKLSGGMKQKLALCCALIHRPTVLFLDEPTTGVDAVSRKEFWEMLQRLKKQGITILVSTPYMDEANLCDRIALIQTGKLLSIDTPHNITSGYQNKLYSAKSESMGRLIRDLRALPMVNTCFSFGDALHFTLNKKISDIAILKENLSNHSNLEIYIIDPSIEDCFIQFMHS